MLFLTLREKPLWEPWWTRGHCRKRLLGTQFQIENITRLFCNTSHIHAFYLMCLVALAILECRVCVCAFHLSDNSSFCQIFGEYKQILRRVSVVRWSEKQVSVFQCQRCVVRGKPIRWSELPRNTGAQKKHCTPHAHSSTRFFLRGARIQPWLRNACKGPRTDKPDAIASTLLELTESSNSRDRNLAELLRQYGLWCADRGCSALLQKQLCCSMDWPMKKYLVT